MVDYCIQIVCNGVKQYVNLTHPFFQRWRQNEHNTALFTSWLLIKMCILNIALRCFGFFFPMKVCHIGSREDGGSPVELGEEDQMSECTIIPEFQED